MLRGILTIAATLCCLAGCGSVTTGATSANLGFSEAQQCTRGGARWQTILGVCEVQGTGVER